MAHQRTEDETYEDKVDALTRRVQRVARAVRWHIKGAFGLPRRILVELRWRLGDEIMAIPIYEALKNAYPATELTVWCHFPELLDGNPYVDAINDEDPDPDRFILLRGARRNVYRLEEYARRAGVSTPVNHPKLYYEDWSTPLLAPVLDTGRPLVVVSTGATWLTKRWPLEHWRQLVSALAESGCSVVQVGQGDERLDVGTCLVDKTTVREAACILHAASLFIGCDSGLMHLALAAGTKALALFGPTDPSILVQNEPNLTVLTNERECQGCWNDIRQDVREGECPLQISECLDPILPECVLSHARRLLA